MKDLVSYIARALVDFPEEVDVSAVEGKHTTVLELRVAKKIWAKLSADRAERPRPSELF